MEGIGNNGALSAGATDPKLRYGVKIAALVGGITLMRAEDPSVRGIGRKIVIMSAITLASSLFVDYVMMGNKE